MNILTINGLEGVGRTSVFEALQKFGDFGTRYHFFSCGNFFEETAKAKGYDSFEDALLDMPSNEPSLDTLLDEEIARLVDEYDK